MLGCLVRIGNCYCYFYVYTLCVCIIAYEYVRIFKYTYIYTYKWITHGLGTKLLFWMGLTLHVRGQILQNNNVSNVLGDFPHDRHIKATISKTSKKTMFTLIPLHQESSNTDIYSIPLGCTRWAPTNYKWAYNSFWVVWNNPGETYVFSAIYRGDIHLNKYIYTYLEPQWPPFLKVNPPKTRPKLQSKQGCPIWVIWYI